MHVSFFILLTFLLSVPPLNAEAHIKNIEKNIFTEASSGISIAPDVQIYQFPLRPTTRARAATGMGKLFISWSPFGVAVTQDGFLDYQLNIEVKGLPPVSTLGKKVYVTWITTPELDLTRKLGVIGESGKLHVRVNNMNKFILFVTAENSPDLEKRSGPIVLRGISPSGLMQNYDSHELFNNMPH